MTLPIAVGFFAGLFWLGFHISKWARKPWYPRFLYLFLAISVCGAIGAVASFGAWYESTHVNLGE